MHVQSLKLLLTDDDLKSLLEKNPPPGESAVYLKSLCIAERECARRLASLIAAPAAAIRIDRDRAVEWFERTEKITRYEDERT